MKLVLLPPKRAYSSLIPQTEIEHLFYHWFWVNDIFIGERGRDFRVTYNDFYRFYKLELFEIAGNHKNCRSHWDEVHAYLKINGYRIKGFDNTWRWEGKKMIRGISIAIYVNKDHANSMAK